MAVDLADARYLILVRHGTREICWDRRQRDYALSRWDAMPPRPVSQFQRMGLPATYAMAGRLADQLELDNIKVVRIVHGTYLATRQTAQIYARVLADRKRYVGSCEPDPVLDPDWKEEGSSDRRCATGRAVDQPPRNRPCSRLECARERIRVWRDESKSCRLAYLVIGHQPDLTEIAGGFAPLPTGILPIGAAESACVRLARPSCMNMPFARWRDRRAGRLLWLLTSRPEKLLGDLHQKIASKYDVAKFFLGALVLNSGLLLNQDLWSIDNLAALVLVALGYLLLLLSLGLTVGTLFAYDRLLMPSAFWGSDRNGKTPRWTVVRPPSEESIVLYYAMVHVWTRLFQPAAGCAIAALVLFLCALAQAELADSLGSALNAYTLTAIAGFVAMGIAAAYYHVTQPNLGTQD